MAQFSSVSRNSLTERRKRLRGQRRWKALQSFWRSLVVLGFAGGAIWLTTLPGWVLRNSQQVNIEGNELLSPDAVRSLLSIDYPKSLWEVKPDTIAQQLEARGPVSDALVTRHLFPPSLTVRIQERRPVAIAYTAASDANAAIPSSNAKVGLLDATGAWIPVENYTELDPSLQLPTLKVLGLQQQYRPQWAKLYQALLRYQKTNRQPVAITEIDWRNPGNIILNTELGAVHLGSFGDRFSQQLNALSQMRLLSKQLDPSQIVYIDLKNPDAPLVQTGQSRSAQAWSESLNSVEDPGSQDTAEPADDPQNWSDPNWDSQSW